ncbi:metallophosphoesterase 1 [Euwallacea fornicatus]|uniref:metallophosphoesterase 1 n=1 Tax=Euwallacea fornicatus TaxID=995702 RepID=UPI00338F5239
MKPPIYFLTRTFLALAFLVFYCEFLIFYITQITCSWPTLDPSKQDLNITSSEPPVKVMVLADTHLLGSLHGHWFDKLRREWQMYRAFQTAITIHKPEQVFVLGDLLDEGLYSSKKEFDYYIARFNSLFSVPERTNMYVVVGNHDIGFHYHINPYLKARFEKGFNAPSVQLVSVRGNHFVLVNSMALEGDGCFLCKPAEEELAKIQKTLACTQDFKRGCNLKLDKYSRPILMQHYPLYRTSDKDCKDFDAAPMPQREKELFRETWECLSKAATHQILHQIKPRLALSGHTHHGCTRPLPIGDGIEITIPSFSWRNKENPNYALGVFTPNNYAISKCQMPKESNVINMYMWGIGGLFFYLLLCKRLHG